MYLVRTVPRGFFINLFGNDYARSLVNIDIKFGNKFPEFYFYNSLFVDKRILN